MNFRQSPSFAEVMSQQWVVDLLAELQRRRAKSHELVEKLRRLDVTSPVFWPFHAPPLPIAITAAQGSQITDADGNTYLDMHMGHSALALHGHNPEPVVRFVRDRMARNTSNGYFNPIELELAELLKELLPHCEKFAFFNSGSDATHAAIRLARAHTGRPMVAKLEGSLHGMHDISVHNTAFWYHGNPRIPFAQIGERGVTPTPAFAGIAPISDDLLILRHNDPRTFELIEQHRHKLSCVIAEAATVSFPFEDQTVPFVRELAEHCAQLQVPFILDEVLTGFRYGISGAAAHCAIPADLLTYGKVMTGLGLPLAAVGGRAEIMDQAQTSGLPMTDYGVKTFMTNTHVANHLSLCGAYAALSLLREQGDAYYATTRKKVALLQDKLVNFRAQHRIPLRMVGFGDFIGMIVILPEGTYRSYRQYAKALNPVGTALLTLLLRQRGVYAADVPSVFTGGCHSEADLDRFFEALSDAALEMKKNGFPFSSPAASSAQQL